MSITATAGYYVQIPGDKEWNTGMSNHVIKAWATDIDLPTSKKTDDYYKNTLWVMEPPSFGWPRVQRRNWIECDGPVRKLDRAEYINLYIKLKPGHPLPSGWVLKDGKAFLDENRFK